MIFSTSRRLVRTTARLSALAGLTAVTVTYLGAHAAANRLFHHAQYRIRH